ncbi:MAG: O-antigen ligase [Flavobacteriaceae bacterium]|nr:O-antigen ligase [Flavobacteriaceae bacterium]
MKNKGLKFLLVFIIISLVNDFWGNVIGVPTLNQIFLAVIIFNFRFKKISSLHTSLKKIHLLLRFYIILLILNAIVTYGQYSSGITVHTTIIKSIIIICLSPYLKDVSSLDIKYFIKYLFYSLLILVFLPGLLELYLNKNIMSFAGGLSDEVFYIRAFTNDKVDFGFNLIMLIGVSFVRYNNNLNSIKKYFYIIVSIISTVLLIFSFSSTNILGLILSAFIYLFFISKNKIRSLLIIFSFGLITFYATQKYHYIFIEKYILTSVKAENSEEFRSIALKESYNLFLESPFFGYGAESNGYLLRERLRLSSSYKTISSHNIITEFTNFGLIGALPILLVFIYVFFRVYKQRKNISPLFIIFIFLTGPLIARLLFYFHRFDRSLYVIWILLGTVIIYNHRNDIKIQSRNNS